MDEYLIGDLLLQVPECGVKYYYGPYMERFRYNGSACSGRIEFKGEMASLRHYLEMPLGKDNGVYQHFLTKDGKEVMVYHWGYMRFAYAVIPEECRVIFDEKIAEQPPLNTDWFFGMCGLHRQFLVNNAPILHASYIDYKGKAILFTAPSQTGKSTQAKLWSESVGAEIVNGDRVLLRKKNEQWHAYGYPCCGSSDICINRTLPLAAVVVLKQGTVNKAESMSTAQKVQAVATGTEVYKWDRFEVNKAIELAMDIASSVPIVKLSCRPDEDAVKTLKYYLEELGIWN